MAMLKGNLNLDLSGIKLVIADMAGTTMQDLHEVELCFQKACEATLLNATPKEILAYQGWKKITVFRELWANQIGENNPEVELRAQASFGAFTQILEEHYKTSTILPTEGTLLLLSTLRNMGIKIALTTGFYRTVTDLLLHKLGWLNGLNANGYNESGLSVIDLSLCSDDVVNGRPAPDMIFLAMEKLGITNPDEVLNIGDTPNDLESGYRAGVKFSLGLTNGTHSFEQLAPYNKHGLLGSMVELEEQFANYKIALEAV